MTLDIFLDSSFYSEWRITLSNADLDALFLATSWYVGFIAFLFTSSNPFENDSSWKAFLTTLSSILWNVMIEQIHHGLRISGSFSKNIFKFW
jgi:hypothetical protein